MFKLISSFIVVCLLSACATADFGSPNTYQRYDVQRIGQYEQATILRVPSDHHREQFWLVGHCIDRQRSSRCLPGLASHRQR